MEISCFLCACVDSSFSFRVLLLRPKEYHVRESETAVRTLTLFFLVVFELLLICFCGILPRWTLRVCRSGDHKFVQRVMNECATSMNVCQPIVRTYGKEQSRRRCWFSYSRRGRIHREGRGIWKICTSKLNGLRSTPKLIVLLGVHTAARRHSALQGLETVVQRAKQKHRLVMLLGDFNARSTVFGDNDLAEHLLSFVANLNCAARCTVVCTISVNSHYLQTRGKNRFLVLCRPSRLVTMVNFSVTTTDSYPKNTRFASAKRSKGVRGAFPDFEMDITLILDFPSLLCCSVYIPPGRATPQHCKDWKQLSRGQSKNIVL